MRTQINKKGEKQTIRVLNIDGSRLHNCTQKRANKLVLLDKAGWLDDESIQLKSNHKMRTALRRKIKMESNQTCYICGQYIEKEEEVTIDHVKPRSKNGKDTEENQKCCCYRCNQSKWNLDLDEYIKHIETHREEFDYISSEQLTKLKAYSQSLQEKGE